MSPAWNIMRATTGILVNEMVRSGVVVGDNPADRRSFYIHRSELGRNKLNLACSNLAVLSDKLSQHFTDDVIAVLNRFAQGKRGSLS